jgi:V8-like Glu-specific endopeptidase
MRVTYSNRIIALTAAAAVAVGAQALLPQTASASPARPASPVSSVRSASQSRAWLTGNTSGSGLRWGHGGAMADAVGKIFFTLGMTDHVCSGALVRSKHVDVVLTAAHCVSGGHGKWATNWTFIPDFRNGAEPYGEYTARRFFVSPKWKGPDSGSERYDVAFVQVTPATMHGRSRVSTPPAGLRVEFARSQTVAELPRTYVFGYPALLPFSGEYANYCAGAALVTRSGPRAGSAATACSMTAGDSGGPWLAGFRPRGGSGAIVAVTAYKLSGNTRTLYGTVLGQAARALYRAATRLWHTIPT